MTRLYMAGPCAERKFSGEDKRRVESHLRDLEREGDAQRVKWALDDLNLDDAEREHIFLTQLKTTWNVVCEGDGWTATQALAAELMKRTVLESAEVEAILASYRLARL